jgi:hypothetical protein
MPLKFEPSHQSMSRETSISVLGSEAAFAVAKAGLWGLPSFLHSCIPPARAIMQDCLAETSWNDHENVDSSPNTRYEIDDCRSPKLACTLVSHP